MPVARGPAIGLHVGNPRRPAPYTLRDSNPQPAGCKPAALPVELKVLVQMDVPVLTTRLHAIRAEYHWTCVNTSICVGTTGVEPVTFRASTGRSAI